MKDIIEEIDSRIKSAFFGYFLFAFMAINWKQLFYLIVHDGAVLERIDHFTRGTDLWSLILLPFILASAYSVIYPWLQLVFMLLSKKPTELKSSLQASSENNLLIKKQELEKSRRELLANTEKELIERAKRDEELEEIEDEDIKEKLKSEIEELRKQRDDIRETINNTEKSKEPFLSEEQEKIIRIITKHGGAIEQSLIMHHAGYDKIRTEYYLEDLEKSGYITKRYERSVGDAGNFSGLVYRLTTKSKKIMIEKGIV